MTVVADDPWAPTLASRLRRALLRLADHVVDYPNADDFDGLDRTGFGPTLGWNNLGGRWDAWGNGTCAPARAPNLWAHGNLATEDFGYEDLESPGFHSKAYDPHTDFVIYYVARVGMQLSNSYYVVQAKRALKTTLARGAKVAIYGVCLVRELGPDFLARCREAIRGKSLSNPWVLFNAASILNLRAQHGS